MAFDFSKLPPVADASFWSSKDGDVLNGTLVGVKWVFNDGFGGLPGKMVNRYVILTSEVQRLMVNSGSIDRQMSTVSVGQYVSITNVGLQKAKNGRTFRLFKVAAMPGMVDGDWLAQNGDNVSFLDCRLNARKEEEEDAAAHFEPPAADGKFKSEMEADSSSLDAKRNRILELAIVKLGAKSESEAVVKTVIATGMPLEPEFYDQILEKVSAIAKP